MSAQLALWLGRRRKRLARPGDRACRERRDTLLVTCLCQTSDDQISDVVSVARCARTEIRYVAAVNVEETVCSEVNQIVDLVWCLLQGGCGVAWV